MTQAVQQQGKQGRARQANLQQISKTTRTLYRATFGGLASGARARGSHGTLKSAAKWLASWQAPAWGMMAGDPVVPVAHSHFGCHSVVWQGAHFVILMGQHGSLWNPTLEQQSKQEGG